MNKDGSPSSSAVKFEISIEQIQKAPGSLEGRRYFEPINNSANLYA
jgi:hypothetical protein